MLMKIAVSHHPQPYAQTSHQANQFAVQEKMSSHMIDLSYLDRPLDIKVDQSLTMPQKESETQTDVFLRPPEVNTLREWGQMILPDGKHKGKTFEEAYTDQNYVFQLRNRRATSTWVRNFQMYGKTRVHHDHTHSQEMFDKGIPVTSEMLSQIVTKAENMIPIPKALPKAERKGTPSVASEEWVKVKGKQVPKVDLLKRPVSEVTRSEAPQSSMMMEPNAAKVQQIQTQIALLQRDLAKEIQIPSEAESS